MTAKDATFDILDHMDTGCTFHGYDLRAAVIARVGGQPYPDTILRYLRIWRNGVRYAECINNHTSLYQVQ